MKIYRSQYPVLTASFTDDENNSVVPPGNEGVNVPDNLWAQYEMKLAELQQLEYAIGEYFKKTVATEEYEDDSELDEDIEEWK